MIETMEIDTPMYVISSHKSQKEQLENFQLKMNSSTVSGYTITFLLNI